MYAPRIFRMTQWGNSDIQNLNPASMALFDEIFAMLEQIETNKINNYRAVWLRADRGSVADLGFEDNEDACEYFGITDEGRIQQAFLREFPDETYWFKLEAVNDRDYYRHLGLRNFSVTIVSDEKNDHPYNYTELLSWIRDGLSRAMGEIKDGTYNQRIEAEVPLVLRYGTIPRSTYWQHCPKDKEYVLKDLTQTEIDRFISIVEAEGKDYIPSERLQNVTFNQYFQFASYAFQAACLVVGGGTLFEQFERYGEDFGGRILNELDWDSHADFLRYFNGEFSMGGHPWGLRRGSSRTRIMLIPEKDNDGWYFRFGGNPNWNVYEIVKMYLALRDHNCPVRFSVGDEAIRYLREEDLIGIVPENQLCVYCYSSFPGMDVRDFRHFDPSSEASIQNVIEWLPFDTLKLSEG